MKKLLKFLISTVVVIVLLIVAAVIALPFILDPNDFKPQITQQVEKATGRELTLGGDINLSFFPWLGVEIHKVSLSNAPGFADVPFAKAADIEVRVKLMPLLQKQVVMDTVVLRNLNLNLARNAQGKTNWEDLVAKEPQKAPEQPSSQETAAPLAALAIAGLKIEAARVHWRDEVNNASYVIKQLNLTTDALTPGKPTDVNLAFDFVSSQPEVHGHVDFAGKITADLEASHYQIQDTDLSLTAAGPALPIEKLALHLGANIDAFLAQQQLSVSDLKLTSQVKGPQEAQLTLTTSLKGDLAAKQYQLNGLRLETQIKDPQFPQPLNATLTTTAMVDLNKETLALQDLSLAALGMQLNGRLNGTNILTEPHLSGYLASNTFNPRQTAKTLAIALPPTADTSVLNEAQLALKFSASPQDFNAPVLVVKLDDSTLKGALAVHNFQQPAIRFDLALDAINVDRYLPPPSEQEAQPTPPVTPGSGVAAGASQLPLETLRALNIGGALKIGRLTAGGIHGKDIRITLNAKDGLIKLHPLQAKLYQGVYAGNIQLDARNKPLKLAIDEKLTGIKVGPLLKDLMGKDKLLGTANINAKLTATGTTPALIRRTLNGTADFSFTNGAIKGINIPQLIREAKARLEGKPLPPNNEPEQTDFTMLRGSITATDGLLRNTDLLAKSPFLRVHGQGTADLVQESINYQLGVSIVKSLKGQGGGTLAELKDITIPLKISGTFTDLNYGIDLESIIKAKAKKLIDKNLNKGLNEILGIEPGKKGEAPSEAAPTPEEQLKQELKNRLKDFF